MVMNALGHLPKLEIVIQQLGRSKRGFGGLWHCLQRSGGEREGAGEQPEG